MRFMDRYTIVLSEDPELGTWTASCPAMPGAAAEAPSRTAAIECIADVMVGWIEVGSREGFSPLEETAGLVARAMADVLDDRAAEGWHLRVETEIVRRAA